MDALNANTAQLSFRRPRARFRRRPEKYTETRAPCWRKVAENELFSSREKNPAFVLMQYFGYLRRDRRVGSTSAGQLNECGGDFRRAEMVKSNIISGEYRQRFGS